MKGRPQKSNAVKRAEGNRGNRQIVGQDFNPACETPERPKGLSYLARREWGQIVALLLEKGTLTKLDGKALAAYCEAYAQSELAMRDVEKYGQLVPTYVIDKETGAPMLDGEGKPYVREWKRNPATQTHKDYLMIQARYLDMFGLSPKSRMSLKLADKPKTDPLDDLLKKPVLGFQGNQQITPGRPFTQPAAPAVNETPAAPPADKPLEI